MSQPKPSGQAYMSLGLRSARLPLLTQRYAPTTHTTHTTYSNTSRNHPRDKASINDQLLTGRKRNYLHTQMYRRGQAFKKIEQENSRLYNRINSQKSLYSQDSMKKSTVSIRSVSRCSSRQSTRKMASISHKQEANKKGNINAIQVQEHNVQKMQKQQINQFKDIFKAPQRSHKAPQTAKQSTKIASLSFYQREPSQKKQKTIPMGNLLHRIAQQLGQPQQIRTSRKKKAAKL